MDSTNNKNQPAVKASLFGFFNKVLLRVKLLLNRIRLARFFGFFNSSKRRIAHQTNLDKKLVYSLSKSRVPNLKQLKYIKKFLSPTERLALRISFLVLFLSIIGWCSYIYLTHLQLVPIAGGEYTEALVGSPKYINPLFANINDVDNNISALLFSSFFKRGVRGELVNDLAQDYFISEDNKIYTFTIREDAKWHNGDPLTVDDIIFTFHAIQEVDYKSSLRQSFAGVSIEKIDNKTVRFVLAEPYAAFLELLTFGIIPQELWYQIPPETVNLAELNLKPVGSGPYKFESYSKDKLGYIKSYHLVRNDDYYAKKPYIENITFNFYINYEEAIAALNNKQVDGISYLPRELKENIQTKGSYNYFELTIPQLTAIFFNQNNNLALSDKKVRQALAYAINTNDIVTNVLGGEAKPINSPILHSSFAYQSDIKKYNYDTETAKKLLDEAGWKMVEISEADVTTAEEAPADDESEADAKRREEIKAMGPGTWRKKDDQYLVIKLTTVNRGENAILIDGIKSYWEAVGVRTNVENVEAGSIQMDVIKPRRFEALFYGLVVGADPDVYVFWHSSQANEGGLNISNFSNSEVDQLLEDARLTSDLESRKEKYIKFQDILAEEVPAIFVYSPVYTYVVDKGVKGFSVETILIPRDRFSNISQWYIKTGKRLIWN